MYKWVLSIESGPVIDIPKENKEVSKNATGHSDKGVQANVALLLVALPKRLS